MNKNHRSHGAPFAGSVPMLGNGMMSREEQAKSAVMQAIQSLSLTIYSRMACEYLATRVHQPVDREFLKGLAKNSRVAAQAYFEGLGIISAEPESAPEQGV
jgi:hypothetical protein